MLTPWRTAAPAAVGSPVPPVEIERPAISEETALLLTVGTGGGKGREDAFRDLYRRHERRLFGLGLSLLLFTIARRMAVDLWRRPSSRPFLPEVEVDPTRDDQFDALLQSLTVRDALDSLSAQHREVLELSYRGDLTQAEIAGRLGVPLGTVKSRTYNALRAFRRARGARAP